MTNASRRLLVPSVTAMLACLATFGQACTTILVGKRATTDGSVLMSTSCDGDMMGLVYVVPARDYPAGTQLDMYYDFPAPATWEEHLHQTQRGYTRVGSLSVEHTYRCVLAAGHLADSVTGGINEHGVSMGIEYMGMNPALVSHRGRVSTCSNHWTSSLIANGLMRAKTAREAIKLMGQMVEEFGFTYYWAPSAGCAIPVVDKNEAWIMEIFGPGKAWDPNSGKPGAVWCAQRVPDDEISCSANRSRIGEIDLTDSAHFMTSPNVYSLARELDLWNGKTPFVWFEVYGVTGGRENSLREWAALNSLAPSLDLSASGDPVADRYRFSVKPDERVDVPTLSSVMRDCYEGTQFDVTERSVFQTNGKKNPLARPFGSRALFELLDLDPERCIGSETSGYVYISQVRDWLPNPIAGCMWFTLGPSYTSCFAPIYSGTTKITESWSRSPSFTRIDRSQAQWRFQLVEDLAGLKYQEAIADVRGVYQPAERSFLEAQREVERVATKVFAEQGSAAAERFVTDYSNACLTAVDAAYDNLVDYLMFKYLYSYSSAAPPELPRFVQPELVR